MTSDMTPDALDAARERAAAEMRQKPQGYHKTPCLNCAEYGGRKVDEQTCCGHCTPWDCATKARKDVGPK